MRQSQLFGKTIREAPAGEVSTNAILLERGGFVYKTMAGVYEYLPLGFRVLQNIHQIIREEINGIGGQEMLLSALQPKERLEKTGRWDVFADIMYRFKDNSGRDVALATTHEEVVTEIALRSIHSYRDLPMAIYQIQTKFRDEPRAKSGLMRGREFLMKDLYSFHKNTEDLDSFYRTADKAYRRIFKRCGLSVLVTEASGGTFTKEYSHEYQALSDAGEDWTVYCASCAFAQNKEISSLKEGDVCPRCGQAIAVARSIEVGNIFKLGTKYAEAFGLHYLDEKGEKHPVAMGCYGIGSGRLMATIVETHHDEHGVLWPEHIAPFTVHLLALFSKDAKTRKQTGNYADRIYDMLMKKGIEVLYDDRLDKTPGEKFADADLVGIPWRIVVSEKTIAKNAIELKRRTSKKAAMLKIPEAFKKLERMMR